ncbi:hypothetical protein C8R46DRAFT_1040841 [Mycena filopes]|nr:hypothetical protein C8R46DRAFT_1040841 [Mycena filopes]
MTRNLTPHAGSRQGRDACVASLNQSIKYGSNDRCNSLSHKEGLKTDDTTAVDTDVVFERENQSDSWEFYQHDNGTQSNIIRNKFVCEVGLGIVSKKAQVAKIHSGVGVPIANRRDSFNIESERVNQVAVHRWCIVISGTPCEANVGAKPKNSRGFEADSVGLVGLLRAEGREDHHPRTSLVPVRKSAQLVHPEVKKNLAQQNTSAKPTRNASHRIRGVPGFERVQTFA